MGNAAIPWALPTCLHVHPRAFFGSSYWFLLMDNACQCILRSANDCARKDPRPAFPVMYAPLWASLACRGSATRCCRVSLNRGGRPTKIG